MTECNNLDDECACINIDGACCGSSSLVSIGPPLIRGPWIVGDLVFNLFRGKVVESVLLQNGPRHPFLPLPINRQTCNLKSPYQRFFKNEVSKGAKEKADY